MRSVAFRNPDVLIADDDPVTVTSVRAALEAAGYSTCTATSGADAVRAASERRPRLVLLDINMPDLDGYAVCKALRAHPTTADVPVLFLSGVAGIDSRIAGFRAGGCDYVAKPFEPEELAARVELQLTQATLRDSLRAQNKSLSEINRCLYAEHAAAHNIQAALLPQDELRDERVGFAWRCVQCSVLGGDAVNIIRLADGIYACYVLDASGHGVPASLMAVAAGYFLAALCGNLIGDGTRRSIHPSPACVLGTVGRVLAPMMPGGQFVTIACGIVDANTGTFTYSSAGHPAPLLLRRGQDPRSLDVDGPPPGLGNWVYRDHSVDLVAGDRIFLHSDGLIEQRGPAGTRLNEHVIARWVTACAALSAQDCADAVLDRFSEWRGAVPIDDDLSLLIIDYVGGAP